MLIGTAKPIPTLPPPVEKIAVLIPISSPRKFTSAPPELPGLMAASVWMKSSYPCSPIPDASSSSQSCSFLNSDPLGRHARSVRYIRGGFHCTAHRCCDLWPLWRSDWAQVHAHCNIDDHGRCDFSGSTGPNLRSIGIWGAVILTILRFIQGVGVGGEWGGSGPDVDGVGAFQQPAEASSRPGRSSACPPAARTR